jgi:hypothetical protein
MQSPAESTDNETVHHEASDIDIAAIFKFVFYLTLVTVAAHVYVWYLMGSINREIDQAQVVRFPLAAAERDRLPPAPRLQTLPREELQHLRDTWRAGLDGYSWMDKPSGSVRLPIDQGMKRVLDAGIPTRPAAPAAVAAVPAAGSPAGSNEKK